MLIGTEVEVAIGHRLMDYEGKCNRLHGHNYRVSVALLELSGYIPAKGMYMDFADVKRHLADILDQFDHAVMLRKDDPLAPLLRSVPGQLVQTFSWNPTAENFAFFIQEQLGFATGLHWTVRVHETSKCWAEV